MKTAFCKHCRRKIVLHNDGWVHPDPDEDPEQEDYGWAHCSGDPGNVAEPRATKKIKARLEYLRKELVLERISYEELNELQCLAEYIEPGDVQLLEAAGVPEFPAGRCNNCMTYFSEEDFESTEFKCPNCHTAEYLMDMPELLKKEVP
jgi:hypothetical protein